MAKAFRPIRHTVKHPRRQIRRGLRLIRQAPPPPEDNAPRDVWYWTRPKYRWRAIGLLLLNAVFFAGLGCFTFWLRTGDYTPFTGPSYWDMWVQAFNPTGQQQVTLLHFLRHPIPANQVPLMMVIIGLVLASMTAIPICVSMLYRFPFSLIFTAIIAFVAVFPWLAITVTFCCWLARWERLQFSFRLATGLISLLPLVAYYALATQGFTDREHLTPLEAAMLYVPWVLAITGACLIMAIVLIIARVVNYRPGAIAPTMALMFATPVVLFELHVGRDELYYRLLESTYGPGSRTHFVDLLDFREVTTTLAEERFERLNDPAASFEGVLEQTRIDLQVRFAAGGTPPEVLDLLRARIALQQYQAQRACEAFRRQFPNSRYLPNVLYLQGQATDTRFDETLRLFKDAIEIRYYQDFPAEASREVWQELATNHPDSPLALAARYKLALLSARAGEVDQAIAYLDDLLREHQARQAAATQPEAPRGFLEKPPAASTLIVDFDTVVLDARQLRDLLVENRDPQQNDAALRELLSFNPHHRLYPQNLERLLREMPERYPLSPLRDNVMVLVARAQPSRSVRIERLQECIATLQGRSDSDALPLARYELGRAYLEDNRIADARQMFEQVRANHPNSPLASEAARRLATMGAARG